VSGEFGSEFFLWKRIELFENTIAVEVSFLFLRSVCSCGDLASADQDSVGLFNFHVGIHFENSRA